MPRFIPRVLECIHSHPMDESIKYTDTSFYVKWFEQESQGTHDTISVSDIISDYVVRRVDITSDTLSVDKGRGRYVHEQIDIFLNGGILLDSMDPVFQEYYRKHIDCKLLPWRTEMPIRSCNETRIVGIIDALFVEQKLMSDDAMHDDDGVLRLHLKDWKVSSDVSKCLDVYSIQLGIYRYILETFYHHTDGFYAWGNRYHSICVMSSEIVVFDPIGQTYEIHNAMDHTGLINNIFVNRKKNKDSHTI